MKARYQVFGHEQLADLEKVCRALPEKAGRKYAGYVCKHGYEGP
jgi:hypothetical protein